MTSADLIFDLTKNDQIIHFCHVDMLSNTTCRLVLAIPGTYRHINTQLQDVEIQETQWVAGARSVRSWI